MTLSFDPAANTTPWTNDFESHLRGLPPRTRAVMNPVRGTHYQQFSGSGTDNSYTFCCRGIVHPIKEQDGFPGWQRITLMKRYALPPPPPPQPSTNFTPVNTAPAPAPIPPPPGQPNDGFGIDNDCWAYEDVVLPGGKIVLGRWWHPFENGEMLQVGPFIFWQVEQGNLITI